MLEVAMVKRELCPTIAPCCPKGNGRANNPQGGGGEEVEGRAGGGDKGMDRSGQEKNRDFNQKVTPPKNPKRPGN